MYRIDKNVVDYLLEHANDPGLKSDDMNPYLPKNLNTFGIVDPFGCFGSDFEYIIESDFEASDGVLQYKPEVSGFWLYHTSELKKAIKTVEIQRNLVDSTVKDINTVMDITDCCIELPDSIEKLTAPRIGSIEELLKLDPNIKKCLNDTQKK